MYAYEKLNTEMVRMFLYLGLIKLDNLYLCILLSSLLMAQLYRYSKEVRDYFDYVARFTCWT